MTAPAPPVAAPAGAPTLAVATAHAPAVPYLLWPSGAVLIAAALGPRYHGAWSVVLIAAGVAVALALLARTPVAWCAAVALLACAGTLWRAAPPADRTVVWTPHPVNAVRGTVEDWPTAHGELVQVPIAVFASRSDYGWEPAAVTLKATVPSYPPLQRGDVVVVGGIATVRRGWWPGADGSLYGQWMRIEQSGDGSTLDDYRHRVVARFIAGIDRFVRAPESGLTTGMLLGEKTAIDAETLNALNATGTTQHVVISGWNIAIVIGFFAAIGAHLTIRRRGLWLMTTLGAIVVYTFAVGGELSVVRAAVMGCGALIAPLVGRRADPLIWLGLASAAMVVHDPAAIGNLSFLLSCTATFGVLVVAPWLAKRAMRLSIFRAVPRLTELLAVAVGAQLMTEPIILHTFGRASLISPLVNLIVEPLVPVIMALGALTSLLSLLPFALPATVAGICTALPASLFLAIVRWAAHFPASAVRLPQPGLALTLLFYALPASAVLWIEQVRPAIAGWSARGTARDVSLYAATFAVSLIIALGLLRLMY
ncbi:MAG: ComEC/Rec2 family competence protein [Thermomicrobiales bacterium]